MYKLTKGINKAIEECKESGEGKVILDEDTQVIAAWSEYYADGDFDIILIHIYQQGVIKFSYAIEETKV